MTENTNPRAPNAKHLRWLTDQQDLQLLTRLMGTSMAAGAVGLGLLSDTKPAKAQVLHFLQSFTVSDPAAAGSTTVSWNIDGAGGVNAAAGREFEFQALNCAGVFNTGASSVGCGFHFRGSVGVATVPGVEAFAVGGYAYVDRLNFGDLINAAQFNTAGNSPGGPLSDPRTYFTYNPGGNPENWGTGNNYLSFRFNPGGGTRFGWARVTRNGLANFTINEWAYNDTPNTAINVGDVPEPGTVVGTLAAVAIGGGLEYQRRKRQAQAKSELSAGESGMAMLAAGAAGIRRWRQQKQQQD